MLATGGSSYPQTGSTGDGYRMAAALGHTIVKLRPSLVPLVVKEQETGRGAAGHQPAGYKVDLLCLSCTGNRYLAHTSSRLRARHRGTQAKASAY